MRFWRWNYCENGNNVLSFVISVAFRSSFLNLSPFLIRYVFCESDKVTPHIFHSWFTRSSICWKRFLRLSNYYLLSRQEVVKVLAEEKANRDHLTLDFLPSKSNEKALSTVHLYFLRSRRSRRSNDCYNNTQNHLIMITVNEIS